MDKKSTDMNILTPGCEKALLFLQNNRGEYTGAELTEATGLKGIHGIMNSLVIRHLVDKKKSIRAQVNGKGLTIDKSCTIYFLTDLGSNYKI